MHTTARMLSLLLLAAIAPCQSDPVADLKAKAIDKRLAAIDAVAASGKKDADLPLQPLLRDPDWEIQERAAKALGRLNSRLALPLLVDLALDGDVRRVRRAAALALNQIDATEAAARLWKLSKGKSQVLAQEALALVLRGQKPFAEADKLKRLLRDPAAPVRESAAAAWLEGAADRKEAIKTLLAEPFVAVRCRALDTIAEAPRNEDLEPLLLAFQGPGLEDVVGRRLVRAAAAALSLGEDDRAASALDFLQRAGESPIVLVRRARLITLLSRGSKPVLDKAEAVKAIKPSLLARDAEPRAAAARALREIGGDDALKAALKQFGQEADSRAQLQLVETVNALRPPTTPEAVQWLAEVVASNRASSVRERAIVRLGRSGVVGAAEALIRELEAKDWQLAVCAAVSLGRTDDDKAQAPLLALLKSADWRLRGAAVVGLTHWSREAAIEPLLAMLEDQHPVVAGAAHEALRYLSRRYDLKREPKAWREWWAAAKGRHDFTDRDASIDKLKKYGYAVPDSEIYQGLDVVVLKSHGDHIEQLLERLEIQHRPTEQKLVPSASLHPEAIFVSNCTGELGPEDVEPLQWFVRTGGYVFGSCWALSETIARIEPGVMQMARTRDQVLDEVRAMPVLADSPLLNGVFPEAAVPIYRLEGAHLIQVQDPERCEVLIDSPDAAERWGCGNLAAWFQCGHGVLFDSANHFDLQGLERVTGLKTDKDRQAYAVDHLGLGFDRLRTIRGEAYWKNQAKASKSVPDLSAFRLLTNFVRSKRSS